MDINDEEIYVPTSVRMLAGEGESMAVRLYKKSLKRRHGFAFGAAKGGSVSAAARLSEQSLKYAQKIIDNLGLCS